MFGRHGPEGGGPNPTRHFGHRGWPFCVLVARWHQTLGRGRQCPPSPAVASGLSGATGWCCGSPVFNWGQADGPQQSDPPPGHSTVLCLLWGSPLPSLFTTHQLLATKLPEPSASQLAHRRHTGADPASQWLWPPLPVPLTPCVVPVSSVHRGTLCMLRYILGCSIPLPVQFLPPLSAQFCNTTRKAQAAMTVIFYGCGDCLWLNVFFFEAWGDVATLCVFQLQLFFETKTKHQHRTQTICQKN